MDTQYYREFTHLALEKNFSRAAAKLHMSHTSLHRHISIMEKEFGAALIVRTSPIKLTAFGRIILEKASLITAEEDEIYRLIKSRAVEVAGTVKILVPSFISNMNRIVEVLYEVRRRYPDVALIVSNSVDDMSVTEALHAGELDIGLVHGYFGPGIDDETRGLGGPDYTGLVQTPLKDLTQRIRFCIREGNPLYDVESPTLGELVANGVVFPAAKTYEDGVNSFLALCKRERVNPMKYYAEVSSLLELWLEYSGKGSFMVGDNVGMNPMLTPSFFENVRLVAPADDQYYVGLDALSRKSDDSPAVAAVLDILSEHLNQNNPHESL